MATGKNVSHPTQGHSGPLLSSSYMADHHPWWWHHDDVTQYDICYAGQQNSMIKTATPTSVPQLSLSSHFIQPCLSTNSWRC